MVMVYGYDMVIIYGMVMVHSCGYGIWLWYCNGMVMVTIWLWYMAMVLCKYLCFQFHQRQCIGIRNTYSRSSNFSCCSHGVEKYVSILKMLTNSIFCQSFKIYN